MKIQNGRLLFSATDLANFLECEHLTALDRIDLETPLPRAAENDQIQLVQAKGFEHEERYLETLKAAGTEVENLGQMSGDLYASVEATRQSMARGVDVIYQAALLSEQFLGYVDFLRRVDSPSVPGRYSYEVVDTKLARSAKAKFVIQLCVYSDLLSHHQGFLPERMHVVLGDDREESLRVASYFRYYRAVKDRFLDRLSGDSLATYPEPCAHCQMCHWRDLCKARWEEDDHLSQVANITKGQIAKLNESGIRTLADLAQVPAGHQLRAMHPATLARLRRQARLQLHKRDTGEDRYELVETHDEGARGFGRLPEPSPGDLFFDMEGDPFEDGGLEYLFGVYYIGEDGTPQFRAFWAHDRQEERTAFEAFIGFVMERLQRFPELHIYHYASYEESALKRLMSFHGVCEAEVDELLRSEKLVDLYRVVREALLVSEPRYSIKNLETFYMDKRGGEVTNAGASIVYYERWKDASDPALLEQIRTYNEDDCRSTYLLRNWLIGIRSPDMAWFSGAGNGDLRDEQSQRVHEAEDELAAYRKQLLGPLPADRGKWGQEGQLRELVFQFLDFHRRAAKPEWWAMFARREMTEEELVDDPECIGALQAVPEYPPETVKRSVVYTFRYPPQELKLGPGDDCLRSDTLERAGRIESIDEEACLVRIKLGMRSGSLPERLSVIPTGPIDTRILAAALYRFADSVISGDRRYAALESLLRREHPRIEGVAIGAPVLGGDRDVTPQVVAAVSGLQDSYLFIQGPPGAGKTYTGSHVIVALLERGARVAVSSNSHKAINNLLAAVERCAAEKNVRFRGVKKCTGEETYLDGTIIEDITNRDGVIASNADLVAGTAWLFADRDLEQAFDCLFVDEAGQVALANLVAMGTCAWNIILLGDQMQLQQPIQGVHPGHSGESALDYLLQGEATIASDRGVFLGTTWRMHDDVCRFISQAVYDGRLHPHPDNQNQRLLLGPSAHPELRPTGIRFLEMHHKGCSQRSLEEAGVVREIYRSLLDQRYRDRQGVEHPMSPQNILVVAPYNLHVDLLTQILPPGARVGTIDKFQGQEAEAVIVSMATSSGDDLPRYLEFLYSKNRLNVALSRARSLVILVANPRLMAIKCHTVEQIELVNTLCWVHEYALAP